MEYEVNYGNTSIIEELFQEYSKNPSNVSPKWKQYFDQLNTRTSLFTALSGELANDMRVYNLIDGYRQYGHLAARVNPIDIKEPVWYRELDIRTYGLSDSELSTSFPTFGLMDVAEAPLLDIIGVLQKIYCNKIGIEYMDLQSPEMEKWIQERIEPSRFQIELPLDQKRMILQYLNKSELLEVFIHTKYVGQKRFSLEGGETLIPMLEAIIQKGGDLGVDEVSIGMAHRGRLNVLSNIMNKSYADIFSEFEDNYFFDGSGDVKYHKGYFSETVMEHGHKIQITLMPNPSHLEAVDPVVEGLVYAKQKQKKDDAKEKVLPILVHGDAALSGQGVIYETLQMYNLPGYSTGGTVHFVINNQVGFTTSPDEGRSTHYCTDIAKAFNAPVFHVNAEDPESCVYVTNLALELRQKFHVDVFIDLNCYRKYGHNESDEPAFTQPLEYQLIRKKMPIREIYRDFLIHQGVMEKAMAESLEEEFKQSLTESMKKAKEPLKPVNEKETNKQKNTSLLQAIQTGVSADVLREIAEAMCRIPEGFTIHRKLEKLIEDRLAMVRKDNPVPLDWGMAENLAYGSLLWTQYSVRLSGQDSGRGTFSHRHALWVDQKEERAYIPLQHLKPDQGRCEIINSFLSEYAVLGFEYGYSLSLTKGIVLWEAQFGDFANGAQIMIDQFISTAEQKWGQTASVILLLPHGYEGQGPEHSSGRIERFLTLCGEDNMFVCNPTLPAQFFHLLRRQAMRSNKKPLIIFTPKGLLRLPECVSPLQDFTQGSFQEILNDPNPPETPTRMILCSGRVYYDLAAKRAELQANDVVIIRIEQLYPLHEEKLKAFIDQYPSVTQYIWVQEEPHNMGPWGNLAPQLQKLLPEGQKLHYVGRPRSASTAVGSHSKHKKEYQAIIDQLFGKNKPSIFEIAGQHKA